MGQQWAFWTPNGKRIIAYGSLDSPDVLPLGVMDADGKNVSHFLKDPSISVLNASWSPDGKRLLFEYSDNGGLKIATSNADGSALQQLFTVPPGGTPSSGSANPFLFPTWSPDGSQIAFIWQDKNLRPSVWLMNADGTNPR